MLVAYSDLIAKAKATIKECSVRDVHDDHHDDALLVDIREPAEFGRGHLPGALLVPRGLLECEILNVILRQRPDIEPEECEIILYCGTGGRSALAAKSLDEMGFRNVVSMDGGIVAWAEARFPLDVPKS